MNSIKNIQINSNVKRLIGVFLSAFLFRLIIYVLYFVIMVMFGEYTDKITFADYLDAWVRWDGVHYINLAKDGYTGYMEEGQHLFLVFLPLYPFLIRVLSFVTGSYELSGLIISTVAYCTGCVYLYKLVSEEYDDTVAGYACIAISVFPFSFFYGGIVTEGLFFAIAAAFIYYLKRQRYMIVGMLGILACLTKLQGGFLAFVVLVYLLNNNRALTLIKNRDFGGIIHDIVIPGLKCAIMLLGIAVYLFINYMVEGDPFRFMYYQKTHWGHTIGPIWNTLKYSLEYFVDNRYTSSGYVLWLPQVVLLVSIPFVIIYAFRNKLKSHYLTYLIVFYLVTFSSTWLVSGGRYCISIIPIYIVLGVFASKNPRIGRWLSALSLLIMMLYAVAYFKWMQIM